MHGEITLAFLSGTPDQLVQAKRFFDRVRYVWAAIAANKNDGSVA
jgi:hypothetical protein